MAGVTYVKPTFGKLKIRIPAGTRGPSDPPGVLALVGQVQGDAHVVGQVAKHCVKMPPGPQALGVAAVDLIGNAHSPRRLVEAEPVFPSLCDPFEDFDGPVVDHHGHVDPDTTLDTLRQRMFVLIDQTPHLDWLLLTKRPENVMKFWPALTDPYPDDIGGDGQTYSWHRSNVWLGVSVSDQDTAEKTIPSLVQLADVSALSFVSIEPLLGPVSLEANRMGVTPWRDEPWIPVDWIVVGGESGRAARPCNVEWIRDVLQQCRQSGVPCFVKQLGSHSTGWHPELCWRCGSSDLGPVDGGHALCNRCDATCDRRRHPKGGDVTEWPEELRVRELPACVEVES